MYDDDYFEEEEYYAEDDDYSDENDWNDDEARTSSPTSLFPPLIFVVVATLLVFFLSGLNTSAQAGSQPASLSGQYADHPGISPLFTPEIDFWGDKIMVWASQTGLDPNLIATICKLNLVETLVPPLAQAQWDSFRSCPITLKVGKIPTIPTRMLCAD